MSAPTSTTRPSGYVKLATRAKQARSLAERSAAEAFVYLMHRGRVRQYDVVSEGWIQATDRPVAGGTSREIVRRFRLAPFRRSFANGPT